MHTIRQEPNNNQGFWQVIFVSPGCVEVIATYAEREEAMTWCSYLNGGFPPLGYKMDVTNHY